jgi:glyoxylase-like metal-dependent hydrolase (beta-lactamase superfamily II)
LSPEKPLSVALTHAHFDHSGGLHQFKDAASLFTHDAEVEAVRSGDTMTTAAWVMPYEVWILCVFPCCFHAFALHCITGDP